MMVIVKLLHPLPLTIIHDPILILYTFEIPQRHLLTVFDATQFFDG